MMHQLSTDVTMLVRQRLPWSDSRGGTPDVTLEVEAVINARRVSGAIGVMRLLGSSRRLDLLLQIIPIQARMRHFLLRDLPRLRGRATTG